jgi:hypothetical protein
MNSDGTVRSSQEISSGVGGGPILAAQSQFGIAVVGLGDLNGDGVPDLAASALAGSQSPGVVHILFLNTNGTVKHSMVIGSGVGGGPPVSPSENFGRSLAAIGDFDGDGVGDMAVGTYGFEGAVYICLMTPQGTIKNNYKISGGVAGFFYQPGFGASVASLGDINGDGVTDLAVGAMNVDRGRGVVHVLHLNANGTVKDGQIVRHGSGGLSLRDLDFFGVSLATLGDIDGDGVSDLAVGAFGDDAEFSYTANRGAVYMLLLKSDGSVKRFEKIAHGIGGAPAFMHGELFGRSLATLGDLDGDGNTDIAVGSYGVNQTGAVYAMFLVESNTPPVFTSPPTGSVPENTTAIMTVTATDLNVPTQTITFSIAGGADQGKFNITSGGQLSFALPPNFDSPSDLNFDNVYNVVVRATDSLGGSAAQTINVTVTPVNDNPPMFTSPDAVNVAENTTNVLTVMAADADLPPQTLTYSIVGGEDQSKFNITSGGALSFKMPPNFEAPIDSNGDNIYIVIVQASDNAFTDLHAILVTVTDVNEPPVGLAGDYNNNGTVDAADYVVWRKALGTSVVLPNDTTPGTVTEADFAVWRANFGRIASPGAASFVEVVARAGASHRDADPTFSTVEVVPRPHQSVQSPTPAERPLRFRAGRRDTLVLINAHDHALQAWLMSKSTGRSLVSDLESEQERPRDTESQEASESLDTLDLAFAAL